MKDLLRKAFLRLFGTPLLWLGFCVVALCASLGMSYHQAQIEADHALVVRLGPPDAVPVSEAGRADTGEAHVIARLYPDLIVPVELGEPGDRTVWQAVPLFDVGASAVAADIIGPRPLGTGPALRRARGLALFQEDTGAYETLIGADSAVFEGSLNGPLVSPKAFALDTRAALAEAGIILPRDFVAIRPWAEGRAAALAPPPASPLGRYLFWASLAFAGIAIGASFRPAWEPKGRYLTIPEPEIQRKIVTRSRIVADKDRFNPLIGQDDIRRGAMERLHAAERANGRVPSTFETAGSTPSVGAGWVKNRR